MTLATLERVMWSVREHNRDKIVITNLQLKRSIMMVIGTDPRTYKYNRKALLNLGWIKNKGRKSVKLTNKDITG